MPAVRRPQSVSQSVSVTRRGLSPPQVQRPIPSRGLKGLQGQPKAHGIATYRTSPFKLRFDTCRLPHIPLFKCCVPSCPRSFENIQPYPSNNAESVGPWTSDDHTLTLL